MTLLHEIQEQIVQRDADLGSILLKLRFLASRLGSENLEEWVKFESEGYPKDVPVPNYRIVGLNYRGTFSGPMGSGIQNAQIPPYVIKKHAGEHWVNYEIRESIAAVDALAKSCLEGDSSIGINASNLILLLQGKIYEGYAFNDIDASISPTAISEIQQSVKSKILELTLEIEKCVPNAVNVTFGNRAHESVNSEKIQQISQQIIYGNVNSIISATGNSVISLNINQGNSEELVKYLVESGVAKKDAIELAEIMKTENPLSAEEPFGEKAKEWFVSNIGKAAKGIWSIGVTVATKVISEAALKYYGLK